MTARLKYEALDGIRGLAALLVLNRHTQEYFSGTLFRSYLAVDVFFLLSGFVIAHSYEWRLRTGEMSKGQFILTRLIRLYPLYIVTVVAALALHPAWHTPEGILRGILMVPTFGQGSLFPLNVVYWSLFFELLVNLFYVYASPALTDWRLAFFVGLLAVLVGLVSRRVGGLYMGFEGEPFHFLVAGVRSFFGIFLGVLIYRKRALLFRYIPELLGPVSATAAICLILGSPSIGRFDWALDCAVVVLFFPICVVIAARRQPTAGLRAMALLGVASYPVYLIHPIVGDFGFRLFPDLITFAAPLSGIIVTAVVLVLAVAVERYVDLPIRRILTGLVGLHRPKEAARRALR